MGKEEIVILGHPEPPKAGRTRRWILVTIAALAVFATTHCSRTFSPLTAVKEVKCPAQPAPLEPATRIQWTDESRQKSTELFQAAVRIPTQSYDDNGEPSDDPRWEPFEDFKKWLEESFPTAWNAANVEFINTLGILATFPGSDESLKPLLLMSHYDVTPAPDSTADRWTHPPFSGENDGTYIWGRGSADDKNLLVAQWEAITHLLEAGFKPRRTLILSHGFDEEEVFARRGQGRIAPFLEERYGKDGLLMVIDEGTGTEDNFFGSPFAVPGMSEKGYLDIIISVGTDGGHSSVPPKHTGIGIMSEIVSSLEDHQFERKLTPSSPILTGLACASEHASKFPSAWSKLLKRGPKGWSKLSSLVAKTSPSYSALVGTTIAVDVIDGGVKVNALPELVTAAVNFRIDFSESVDSTKAHVEKILRKAAKKHDLEFSAWSNSTVGAKRYINVQILGLPLEPAPPTPSTGGVWDLFAGTVRAAIPAPEGKQRIVTPFASTGNTDCKMYYNLTRHVYRFNGAPLSAGANIHTVDERFRVDAHWGIVDWIHAIIQNADAYTGEE